MTEDNVKPVSMSIHEIKKELLNLDQKEIIDACLRLARYKKENKELLAYLLFDAADEKSYVDRVKKEMDQQMAEMNENSLYLAKKTIRKVLRTANKYIRYSGIKETEIELRIHFCKMLKHTKVPVLKLAVISNLYNGQLKKINTAVEKLHEDMQYDFRKDLESL